MLTRKMKTGIVFSLVLAVLVMAAISFYADLPRLVTVLTQFRWEFLPLILGLTLFNYFGRFLKWHYYLRRLGIRLAWRRSLLIFLSGLSMAITPGKVGELLKSYLLKRSTGEPISRTSPIIMCERLTDGLAMIGLAATGLVLYRFGGALLLGLLAATILGILVVQNRRLSLTLLDFGARLPLLSRIAHLIRTFYESAYTLLEWRPLLLGILFGLISWSGECGALYFVFAGLGLGFSPDLIVKATFILSISSLVGSASGLPGGLGTADGSMLGLTRLLVSPSAAIGGAATLLIRLCTLWFGLGVGVLALLLFRAMQRGGIFLDSSETVNHLEEHKQPGETREDERSRAEDLQTASAASSSGETIV